MDNEIIHRSLSNPRILGRPLFEEEQTNPCPRHNARPEKQEQELDDVELELPSVIVEVLPTGEVVGKASKQLEKEPLHVRIDKFGYIVRVD